MAGSVALLDGKPLIGSVEWGLSSGVRARTAIVNLSRENADEILSKGYGEQGAKLSTLHMAGADRSRTFEGLYVLHRVAGPNPHIASVMIADRRWLWRNAAYRRFLNVRRKIGTKRLSSANQLEDMTLDPKFVYAPWSLRNGAAWTAKDLLEDLADAIKRFEREEGGGEPAVIIPDLPGAEQLPIQDLELVGQLDECVERALSYLPGLDVTVDPNGRVRFFWRTTNEENAEIEAALPEAQTGGHVEPITLARIRPRKVRVYFTIEAETRVDVEEAGDGVTQALGEDDWWATNVLPVTDYRLSVGGNTLTTGTWINFGEAFTAWGSAPGIAKTLTYGMVRRAFVPFNNLWNVLRMHGQADAAADWSSRIGALQRHYRQTFRLNPRLMDKLSEIRAYRVATINPELGTRGRASVWTDYSYLPTMRSLIAEESNNKSSGYITNVVCYPSSGDLADVPQSAPADLTILDSDQGVFRVDFHSDTVHLYEVTLPSQVEVEGTNTAPGVLVNAESAGPSPYLRRSNRPIAWNVLGRNQEASALTARHKLSAIFTAVPGSPNSKRSMCWVDISPTECAKFPGQGNCNGPMLEIVVGPGLETARMAWKDDRAEDIRALFNGDGTSPVGPDEDFALKDLVINYAGESAGGASLRALAIAHATRIYHAMRDRQQGTAEFAFRGDAQIAGSMQSVEHELSMTGAILTRMDLPMQVPAFDLGRYLDASTRRIVYRLINPGR